MFKFDEKSIGSLDLHSFINLTRYLNVKGTKMLIKETFGMVVGDERGNMNMEQLRKVLQEKQYIRSENICKCVQFLTFLQEEKLLCGEDKFTENIFRKLIVALSKSKKSLY